MEITILSGDGRMTTKIERKRSNFGFYLLIGFLTIPGLPMTIMFSGALIELHPITHIQEQSYLDKYEPSLTILMLITTLFIWFGIPLIIRYFDNEVEVSSRSPIQ